MHRQRRKHAKLFQNQHGYILGMVMIFFVVFTILGLSFIRMGGFERLHAFHKYYRTKAFYRAEAGIHKGLWLLNNVSKAAATYSDSTVSVVYDSVGLSMIATGIAGNAQDSIRITVEASDAGQTGGTNLLFVVSNDGSLSSEETAIKALLESWGYTVTVIDEDDSQTEFDTALVGKDVVYVGEDVNSGDLNTKIRHATIGIVNEEGNLVDELGIAASHGYPSPTTTVTIADNTHYITSKFSLGSVALFSTSQPVTNITSTQTAQAPGLMVLGHYASTEPSIIALEQDSTIYDLVLMMVADSGSPSTQANLRKSQLESWDYAVQLIEDGDSQSDFDTWGAKSIVSYIPDEVNSGDIDKVEEFIIGVVCEDEDGDNDLGFTSANGQDYSGTQIDITDNSHYITSVFSTGNLTILSASDDLTYLNGTLAGGLQVLAERVSSSSEVLAIVDSGATLHPPPATAAGRRVRTPFRSYDFDNLNNDGLTLLKRSIEWAAELSAKVKGRRVELPWGGDSFDINSLTYNGKKLMRRAVEWAAGASGGGGTPTYRIAKWEDL